MHFFEVLQSLYRDEAFCDIELKTDDGKLVKGHKIVFALSSPYFGAMFTGFEGSSKECVNIREINSTALRLLVDFLYTVKIIVTEENVQVGGNDGTNCLNSVECYNPLLILLKYSSRSC